MLAKFFRWVWALILQLWTYICTRLEVNDLYLVLNGKHEHIMKRLHNDEKPFAKPAQKALLNRGNTDEIVAMIKSGFAVIDSINKKIVERNIGVEIKALCDYGKYVPADIIIQEGHVMACLALAKRKMLFLTDADLQYVLQHYSPQNAAEIIMNCADTLTQDQMLAIIDRKNDRMIKAMFRTDRVYASIIFDAIVDSGCEEATGWIAEHYALSVPAAIKYLHKYADNIDMLDDFIYNDGVECPEIQLEIAKTLGHNAVMSMLDVNNELCAEAQLAIVKKGNMAEIQRLITEQNKLDKQVIDILLERNAHSEMLALAEHQQLDSSVLMHWVNNCRFDYVEIYLANNKTDSKFTQRLILEVLKRTVQ